MKKLTLLSLLLVLFTLLSVNFADAAAVIIPQAKTNEEMVQHDIDAINLPNNAITGFPVTTKSVYGCLIEYTSSNEDILNVDYVSSTGWIGVTRTLDDQEATLTLTVSKGDVSAQKTQVITIKGGVTISREITITLESDVKKTVVTNVGKLTILEEIQKEGFVFLGWYKNLEDEGSKVTTTLGLLNDITLYAKFEKITLKSIAVTTEPLKTVYNAFEEFDPTGMVVTGTFSDGSVSDISEYEIKYIDNSNLRADHTYVTIKVDLLEVTVSVIVNKIDFDLSGISFNDKNVVYDGQEHSITVDGTLPDGLEVNYANAEVNAGTYDMNVSFTVLDKINYNQPDDLSAKLTILKASPKVNPLYDQTITYYAGQEAPKLILSEDDTLGVISWSENYLLKAGLNQLKWKFVPDNQNYLTAEGEISITAVAAMVSSIVIKVNPTKLEYVHGETFDLTGASIFAIFSDNSEQIISLDEVIIVYENGGSHLEFGDTKVTISYLEKSAEIKVTVTQKNIELNYNNMIVDYDSLVHSFDLEKITGIKEIQYSDNNAITNCGTVVVTVTFVYENGYTGLESIELSITVNKIDAVVSPDKVSKVFGDADPLLTFSVSGLLNDDVLNGLLTRDSGENVGNYAYSIANLSSNNYNISLVESPNEFTITAKDLSTIVIADIDDVVVESITFDPQIVEIKLDGLTENTDFTVTFINNDKLGKVNVVITFIGNYTGTVEKNFNIVLSKQAAVNEAAKELNALGEVDTEIVDSLPVELYGALIAWTFSSTQVAIDPLTGKISVVKGSEEVIVTATASITLDDVIEVINITVKVGKAEIMKSVIVKFTNDLVNDSSAALSADDLLTYFDKKVISSITNITKVYKGKNSSLKLSSSKENGCFTINLMEGIVVKKVIISAIKYNTDNSKITIEELDSVLGTEYQNYEFELNGLTSFTINATKRCYINAIEIFYE